MSSLIQRSIVLFLALLATSVASFGQVIYSDDFEANNVGDFPAGWTQVNGSVGYAVATASPVAFGTRAVRLSAGLSTASTIRITTAITNDYSYEYYVLIPDTGNTNENIGSVKVEGVGMNFAIGATTAEGLIYFSNMADGFTVTTNVYHHVKVDVDYQKSVFQVSVDGGPARKYPASISTSQDLRLEASSLSSTLQKHIVYVDSVSVTLMTVDLTPAYTSLSSPADLSTGLGASSSPSFSWSSVSQATGYQIQIGTDSTFAGSIAYDDTTLTGTSKTVPLPPLAPATSYFWRVRAKNTVGWGDWSTVRRFRTVDPPTPPEQYSPSPGEQMTSTGDVYFSFSSPSGTQTYHLQVAEDSLFTQIVVNDSASSANSWRYIAYPPLEVLKRYYWRIRAFGVAGWGDWAAVRDFFTPQPLAPPNPSSPANGGVITDVNYVYTSWSFVSNASAYHLQVATDSLFTAVVYEDSTETSTAAYVYFPPLTFNTVYYWRVRTLNVAGWSAWSVIRWYKTKPTPLATPSSPPNGSVQWGSEVALSISTTFTEAADTFRIQISLDSLFTQIVADTISDNSFMDFMMGRFAASTTYYWRVSARNVAGWGPLSAWRTFVTADPPPPPTLNQPNNNITVTLVPVYFSWGNGGATGIQDYRLEIASDSNFTNVLVDTVLQFSGHYLGEGKLLMNTRYYWRVRTRTNVGSGAPSAWRTFLTPQRPPRPTVIAPASGAMDLFGFVAIRWSSSTTKDSSWIQISTDTSTAPSRVLGGAIKARTLTGNTVTTFHYGPAYSNVAETDIQLVAEGGQLFISGDGFNDEPIFPGQELFIRVVDFNEGGQSDWSEWTNVNALRPPSPPTGLEPVNGATGVPFYNLPIRSDISEVSQTTFNATIANAFDLAVPHAVETMYPSYTDDGLVAYIEGLLPNTTYFYQVTAFNPLGVTQSPVFSFTTANPIPVLTCVMDVPNDQGGFLDIDFLASELDRPFGTATSTSGVHVNEYSGWRLHEPSSYTPTLGKEIQESIAKLPESIRAVAASFQTTDLWEPVFHFAAIGEGHYRVMVKSRSDSGKKGPGTQTVVVIAHSNAGHQFRSAPMSGYSVDNLAPAAPVGGTAVPDNGQVRVTWVANDEEDLKEYVVYRALTSTESISSMTPIGTTTETIFIDASPPNVPIAYYYVVARDKNENDGEPAIIQATIVTGVETLEGIPTEFVLGQNYPNPFNPTTTIKFGVPSRSSVRVQVINTLGQVVEELIDAELPAGYFQSVWEARVPSGLYFARMVAAPVDAPEKRFSSIKKMMLLK